MTTMGITDIMALIVVLVQTAERVRADGRTQTTAEELATLQAALGRRQSTSADLDAMYADAESKLSPALPAPAAPAKPTPSPVHTAAGQHSPYPHP